MAALLAYLITAALIPLFLLVDWLSGGFLVGVFYSPVPLGDGVSWVGATVLYLGAIYLASWLALRALVGAGRALEGAGQPPRWLESIGWLDPLVRRDDGRWPLALAAVAGGLGLVTLPALAAHLVSPITWTLVTLAAPTIVGIYRDRIPPEPIEAMPERVRVEAPATAPPAPAAVLAGLRASSRYRGQLRAVVSHPPRPARPWAIPPDAGWVTPFEPGGLLHAAITSYGLGGLDGLFAHQQEALQWLLQPPADPAVRQHVVLATGPGSGRRLTTFLMALETTLLRGGHVLVVTPDEAALETELHRFNDVAERTDWRYALAVDALRANDRRMSVPDPPPEILFCTLETLHGQLLRDHEAWWEFFDALELVVAHDLDALSGIVAANAAQVFRRLGGVARLHQQRPHYIATARPAENAHAFASQLLALVPASDHLRVIELDGSPRPAQLHAVWLPALDRQPSQLTAAQLTRRLARQERVESAAELVAMLLRSSEAYRVLVHCHEWGRVEASALEQRIFALVGQALPAQRLTVTRGEADLDGRQRAFDALVILGTPLDAAEVQRIAGPLGFERNGGLVIVHADHSTVALDLIAGLRHPSPHQPATRVLPLNAAHPEVVARHLRCAAAELRLTRGEITTTFGRVGLEIADGWVRAGRARYHAADPALDDDQHRLDLLELSDPADDPWASCRLDTVGDDLVIVETEMAEPVLHVDAYRQVAELYPYRSIARGEQLLTLRPDDGGGRLVASIAGDAVWRQVQPRITTELHADVPDDPRQRAPHQIAGGTPIQLQRLQADIHQQLVAVVSSEHGIETRWPVRHAPATRFRADALVIGPPADPLASGALTDAPRMDWPAARAVARALETALRARLPPEYPATLPQIVVVNEVETLTSGPTIAIFDTVDGGMGLATAFETQLPGLLADAYRVLVSCPCRDGCPACIGAARITQTDDLTGVQEPSDKRGALRFLGERLGRRAIDIAERTPEELDRMRYEGYPETDDGFALNHLLNRVLTVGVLPILDPHGAYVPAGIRVTVEPYECGEPLGHYLIGLHATRLASVRPAIEETLAGVIAHVYAHDWQRQAGADGRPNMHPSMIDPAIVPYDGRLIEEGFAQWLELRVLDALGFAREHADVAFTYFDGYVEGFHLIKHIEDTSGVAGVLAWLREPLTGDELERKMRDAGVAGQVHTIRAALAVNQRTLPERDILVDEQPAHAESPDGRAPVGDTPSGNWPPGAAVVLAEGTAAIVEEPNGMTIDTTPSANHQLVPEPPVDAPAPASEEPER